MFDCGMHMGFHDERRFPDFSRLSPTNNFDGALDCVIITHFHLDHCGALPHFTEICGYNGPILMTHPTKAICPILLEDFRKISVDKKGDTNFFSSSHIKNCMKKVTVVSLNASLFLADDFEIRAFYAGHVIGAAMFWVRVGSESVVYTGDYNMTPDRHLGSAWIETLNPTLLITETTYATTLRDSKRTRERDFLKKIHDCVLGGGKVLIPVFAVGRAQELCILIESYWERSRLGHIPVYFSAGMTEKANTYYKLFIEWTNERIKKTFSDRNMFDFRHIRPFDKTLIDAPGPMVLFSSPGMLHSGMSLEVFKRWATDARNTLIIPGFCVPGTLGARLLAGQRRFEIDRNTRLEVQMHVENMSFSAHADARGIMQLISQCRPRYVMLVHGEKSKMEFLREQIVQTFKVPCFLPANGDTLLIDDPHVKLPINISHRLLAKYESLRPFADVPLAGIVTRDDFALEKLAFLCPEATALEGEAAAVAKRACRRFTMGTTIAVHAERWQQLVARQMNDEAAEAFCVRNVCAFVHRSLLRQVCIFGGFYFCRSLSDSVAVVNDAMSAISVHNILLEFASLDVASIAVKIEWEYYVSLEVIFHALFAVCF